MHIVINYKLECTTITFILKYTKNIMDAIRLICLTSSKVEFVHVNKHCVHLSYNHPFVLSPCDEGMDDISTRGMKSKIIVSSSKGVDPKYNQVEFSGET